MIFYTSFYAVLGSYSFRIPFLNLWYLFKFLPITKGFPELEIQINPEGLHKYKEYCKGINVFFPEK